MNFQNCFESEVAEEFLETLLTLMQLTFLVNRDYRKNIKQFTGKYQFKSMDGKICVAASFNNGRMKVIKGKIDDPNIKIIFRNGKTLLNYMMSPRQDILGSMLRQDVIAEGNLNYLYKFGYMAKELQLMIPKELTKN